MVIVKTIKSKIGNLQGAFPNIDGLFGKVTDFVRGNPIVSTAIVGISSAGAVAGLVAGVSRVRKTKKKKSTPKKKRKCVKRKTKKTKRKGRSKPRTAGKGKDRSTRRIRYTKNKQPYVILRSGKARFIKKSSARRSHKLKGGRY